MTGGVEMVSAHRGGCTRERRERESLGKRNTIDLDVTILENINGIYNLYK